MSKLVPRNSSHLIFQFYPPPELYNLTFRDPMVTKLQGIPQVDVLEPSMGRRFVNWIIVMTWKHWKYGEILFRIRTLLYHYRSRQSLWKRAFLVYFSAEKLNILLKKLSSAGNVKYDSVKNSPNTGKYGANISPYFQCFSAVEESFNCL